jgi:hypothetical protein
MDLDDPLTLEACGERDSREVVGEGPEGAGLRFLDPNIGSSSNQLRSMVGSLISTSGINFNSSRGSLEDDDVIVGLDDSNTEKSRLPKVRVENDSLGSSWASEDVTWSLGDVSEDEAVTGSVCSFTDVSLATAGLRLFKRANLANRSFSVGIFEVVEEYLGAL